MYLVIIYHISPLHLFRFALSVHFELSLEFLFYHCFFRSPFVILFVTSRFLFISFIHIFPFFFTHYFYSFSHSFAPVLLFILFLILSLNTGTSLSIILICFFFLFVFFFAFCRTKSFIVQFGRYNIIKSDSVQLIFWPRRSVVGIQCFSVCFSPSTAEP